MKRAAFALALVAQAGVAAAQPPAPPPACLAPAEFTALATYTLPGAVTAIAERCTTTLPADAFLRTGAGDLAARYRLSSEAAWPGAKAAFLKVSAAVDPASAGLIGAMPDQALRGLVGSLFSGTIAAHVRLDDCGTIDRALALLAPLPPEATAELIGVAVGLGTRGGPAHIGQITICSKPQEPHP